MNNHRRQTHAWKCGARLARRGALPRPRPAQRRTGLSPSGASGSGPGGDGGVGRLSTGLLPRSPVTQAPPHTPRAPEGPLRSNATTAGKKWPSAAFPGRPRLSASALRGFTMRTGWVTTIGKTPDWPRSSTPKLLTLFSDPPAPATGMARHQDGEGSLVQGLLLYPDGGRGLLKPSVLPTQHIFAELGGIHPSPAAGSHTKAFLKQSLEDLHGVEPAIAVQREADDVCGVLVPSGIDRIAHDIPGLREDFLDKCLLPTEGDALAEVGRHADHEALAGLAPAPLLLLLLPAIQLPHHGLQLVVAGLLIQEAEVLKVIWQQEF